MDALSRSSGLDRPKNVLEAERKIAEKGKTPYLEGNWGKLVPGFPTVTCGDELRLHGATFSCFPYCETLEAPSSKLSATA